jgi:hypothetical protein
MTFDVFLEPTEPRPEPQAHPQLLMLIQVGVQAHAVPMDEWLLKANFLGRVHLVQVGTEIAHLPWMRYPLCQQPSLVFCTCLISQLRWQCNACDLRVWRTPRGQRCACLRMR